MPDTLTNRLPERIDRVFEARERHLEAVQRAVEATERAHRQHAERFRSLVDEVIRPVMERAGGRLRELGHDVDITDHGLLANDRFGDDQQIRLGLSLGGRGDHAFTQAGEASLAFVTNVDEPTVTVRVRVLGRDRSAMSPYRRSHDDSQTLDPEQLTEPAVEDLVVAFLAAAVASTYDDG